MRQRRGGGRRAQGSRAAAAVVCAIAALGVVGCASHRSTLARVPDQAAHAPLVHESLGSYIAKVRALSAVAKPPRTVAAQTLESWDPRLAAALADLALGPTAQRHRRVAVEYRRCGVLDLAHAHLSAAVRLDPTDAAAYEGRARIWRDWGFPALGLPDAYRAVRLVPASAAAANTVGTLLEAAGRVQQARQWYERALVLEPGAPYAFNNLCYAAVMMSDAEAVSVCRRALDALPGSQRARDNLGLAYAADDDMESARAQLQIAGDPAATNYNLGIVYTARRQFKKATEAFAAALRANPQFTLAAERARQARAALGPTEETGDHR